MEWEHGGWGWGRAGGRPVPLRPLWPFAFPYPDQTELTRGLLPLCWGGAMQA